MQRSLTIEHGDEVLVSLGLSPEEFVSEARFLLAAKLYELGRLSSGQAAHFCGLERVSFLSSLARVGVPACNLQPADLASDLEFAEHR